MMRHGRHCLSCLPFLVLSSASLSAQALDPEQVIRNAAESGETTWRKANELPPDLTGRQLFHYALALCETRTHPERLERLFDVAARMQDRDPKSRGYGNFRWKWEDGAVLDYNAVEFCMQSGTLLWKRHRETMLAAAREKLRELLEYAVEGCLRHRVPSSYTNIALMNAQDLILLGEVLGRPEVAGEGYKRLDQFCIYTWEHGIHEYCSPTYYGTDLDCLVLIEAFCEGERGREQARALLELLWSDIALNWFEPSQRLAGARSRDYDYLRGLGGLDRHMEMAGWLAPDSSGSLYAALARWQPPERLRQLNLTRYPRLVRQSWGIGISNSRTHYVTEDVTLSSSGANYGSMDLPLTVDLPGDRSALRCYFIPDARRDPYGKKKIPAGTHQKTLHLRPFFTAAQRRVDALGLVVYRDHDLPENPATLESHFVMPKDVDGVWMAGDEVEVRDAEAFVHPLGSGEALVLRKGTAAVGIRVPWARGLDGQLAPAALVYDGNEYGAMRLTVAHHNFWGVEAATGSAGAAFWIRIGSGLESDDAFEAWRRDFRAASARVDASPERLQIAITGQDGPVAVAAAAPYLGPLAIEPPPSRAVLELDGQDIGRELLKDIEPIKSYEAKVTEAPELTVAPGEGTYWEAESGFVAEPMVIGDDDDAFGARFVWMPGEPGEKGGGAGSVTWRLNVSEAGQYYLWGRLLAPTPDDDSFLVRVFTETAEPVGVAEWHTGTHQQWEWTRVNLNRSVEPTPIPLPRGEVRLQLRVREDGTKIDRLFITTNPDGVPR